MGSADTANEREMNTLPGSTGSALPHADAPAPSDARIPQDTALRRRAEDLVQKAAAQSAPVGDVQGSSPVGDFAASPDERDALSLEAARQTLHELRVHQIELEIQNEELRRTQGELIDARQRYFDLYDMAPVGYCTISETGVILQANLTAATLLAVARSALVDRPIAGFILPADQETYYRLRQQLCGTGSADSTPRQGSGQGGSPQTGSGHAGARHACELRMLRSDTTTFWALLDATATQDAAGASVCRVTITDITERKRAEAALKQAHDQLAQRVAERTEELRQANDELRAEVAERHVAEKALRKSDERSRAVQRIARVGYLDLDLMTRDLVTSTEALAIYHLDTSPTLEGLMGLVHPDDKARVEQSVNAAVSGTARHDLEHRMICPDGTEIYVQAAAELFRHDDGTPARLLGTILDITARKRAQAEKEELEILNRQLQKSESLGRMAGAVAHHFNNRLQVVTGSLESALWNLSEGADVVQSLNDALRATRRASEVSALMLTYLGQAVTTRELLDLAEVCGRHLSMLEAATPKNLVLEVDLPSPGPIVRANANQIQQVLANLVTNAWEAAGDAQGSIRVTVNTVALADIPMRHRFPVDWHVPNDACACLEVADTGLGIADEDIERIFDPFYSSKFTGRGMGLPVVLGIVRAHEGAIAVESTPGRGSSVRGSAPPTAGTRGRSPGHASGRHGAGR
jgi:two-component system cell cycle sensor histidine kinase/response regulator CckA